MSRKIVNYMKKLLCIVLATAVIGTILVHFSIHTCYGFYEIKQYEVNDEDYYIYITNDGKLLRLSCNKIMYDIVEKNKSGWFEMEFKYSSIFHNICYVTFLKLDEVMSD